MPPPLVLQVVRSESRCERRSGACSLEKAEVHFEDDSREPHYRIACRSERHAARLELAAQIRPKRYDALARNELARAPRRLLLAWQCSHGGLVPAKTTKQHSQLSAGFSTGQIELTGMPTRRRQSGRCARRTALGDGFGP